MPIVITSAFGNGSAKKSRGRADTRSARPAAAILRSAIRVDLRQVRGDASQMRMLSRDEHREQAGGAADVAQRPVAREVELLGERLEVPGRDPGSSHP